jgi:hypothetical protein
VVGEAVPFSDEIYPQADGSTVNVWTGQVVRAKIPGGPLLLAAGRFIDTFAADGTSVDYQVVGGVIKNVDALCAYFAP